MAAGGASGVGGEASVLACGGTGGGARCGTTGLPSVTSTAGGAAGASA